MRGIPDQFWWVQRYGGVALTAGFFAVLIWLTLQTISDFMLVTLDEFVSSFLFPTLISLGMCALMVLNGISQFRKSFRNRERFRRRKRAIEGDQEAMPRAIIRVERHHAPKLSGELLELLWRATPLNSRIMTTIMVCMIVIFGPCAALLLYLAYCLATNTPTVGGSSLVPMSFLERVGYVAVALFFAGMFAFLVVFVIKWLPWERGRPYGVTANNEGLWYYPRGRKRRFLRWDEARLLEVSSQGQYRTYALHGGNGAVRWWELPRSSFVTPGLTKQEFGERHQVLLDVIAARTGLLPRTFDKKLAEGGSGI